MEKERPDAIRLSTQALMRMPYYLQYLKKLRREGIKIISSPSIAASLDFNEVQVRKDFAAVSTERGKPRAGFPIDDLIRNMEDVLGYHNSQEAVLVGAGSLGRALLSYKGFEECGMRIVAAFDADEKVAGTEIAGKSVFSMERLGELCRRMSIHIGIIAVPAEHAQNVCDQLVAAGVLAIWNFAPVHLTAPGDILVKNENIALSLAVLSKHLKAKMKER